LVARYVLTLFIFIFFWYKPSLFILIANIILYIYMKKTTTNFKYKKIPQIYTIKNI
jgi:hypothetical protein